ncbi:MAG: AsmA-like C-terminal region-containing protein, partial [Candidatus Rokuibacteriota bacterium]
VVKPGDLAIDIEEGSVGLSPSRTLFEAPVKARLLLKSKTMGQLVAVAMGPSPKIAGGLSGALVVSGTVGKPRAAGDIDLNDLAVTQAQPGCPDPKQRTLTLGPVKLNAVYENDRVAGRPVTTTLAGGTITTNLTATLDRGVHVTFGDLAVKGLSLEKVLVDYLCQGYAVTGPLDLMGTVSFSAADMWKTLSGSGKLAIGSGRIVGAQALALLGGVTRVGGAVSSLLSADLPPSLFASPLEFESITGTYTAKNGVVTTRDLLYTSPAMKVAVAGTYNVASGAMNLDMVVNTGRNEVQAKVTGTAASPSIRVNPASVLKNVDPGQVEKGLQDLLKRFR